MATAVSAYKYETTGYESLGKLGLAIIGKKESNCYQLLLYRGKQIELGTSQHGQSYIAMFLCFKFMFFLSLYYEQL